MDCKYHSSDRHSGAEEGNTRRAKATIVDVARKALLDLNASMRETKSWESQRSIFTNKICNQNEKIRQLKESNDSLTSDVENLKSHLADAVESNTRIKFEDREIDALVVGSTNKIIRTIDDLSSELVSLYDTMNVFRDRNQHLQMKTDKLTAMVRVSSGNCKDFRSRVDELNVFTLRIDEEIFALKNSLENVATAGSLETYRERTKNVAVLMNELEIKLKNDRDALFTGGNSGWSVYLKRIAKLEGSSDDLLRQLEITKSEMRARSCGIESPHLTDYPKRLDELVELVKRVGCDLKSLKTEPMMIGSRVGGESCAEYSRRIRTLWKLVATSKSIINKLIIESQAGCKENPEPSPRVPSASRATIGALETLAKKFRSGIKELEIVVASGDNAKLIQKIRQLESSVGRLKSEIAARDEEHNSIGLELTGAKIAFGEKVEALEELQAKYEKLATKLRNRKHRTMDDDQQRIESLARELEETRIEAQDSKILRSELNELRRFAENFQTEKSALLAELRENQVVIEDREKQVLQISKEKCSLERTLKSEKMEIQRNLVIAVEEINSLKKEISELKEVIVSKSNEGRSASEASEVKLSRLQAQLEETNRSLEIATNECKNLQSKCNEAMSEKTKADLEISRMKIQNEALIDHLNSEKVTTAETLQDCQKLMADFRLQEIDLQTLRTELTTLRKCLEDSEREKDTLKAEVNDLRQGSLMLRDEALTLKQKVNSLTLEVNDANSLKAEVNSKLTKLEEEKRQQCLHIDFLANENEKLNDQLDKTRADKLDIAGTMNEWRLQCEATKSLLDSKTEEARTLSERLRQNLRETEALKARETATRQEAARSQEANVELREAIDVLMSVRAKLEEQLGVLSNECQTLRTELEALKSDNEALTEDSSVLRRRADALTEDAMRLTRDVERHEVERAALIAEHQDTSAQHQKRLDDFAIEHATLKAELERLRAENTSLKSESTRLTTENEKMRRDGGKIVELSRLTVENEGLKHELANLRNASSKAVREAEAVRVEREKLGREVRELRAEKLRLEMLAENSRKVEKRLDELRAENEELRRLLEEAKNDIARRDNRTNGLEAERTTLKRSIEELTQRHRAEAEALRSRNESLAREMSDLGREDAALREEVKTLRSVVKKVNDESSRMRTNFGRAEDELVALKAELARARAENELLKSQYDARRTESCRLESENAALKDKLEELRRFRISDAEEEKQLRCEFEKLRLHKVTLEGELIEAQRKIGEYTVATSSLDGLEDKLKRMVKEHAVTKELLRSRNEEVVQLRRKVKPLARGAKYGGDVRAT